MKEKLYSYLGFAKKSGNLIAGADTCTIAMNKGKIKSLLIAADVSENTLKKMVRLAENRKIPYRVFGEGFEIARAAGSDGRYVFGIRDENFTNVIFNEIDKKMAAEREEV